MGDHHDYSDNYGVLRERLMVESGGEYRTFLQGLNAHYTQVWRDMALGYFALALCLYLVGLAGTLPRALLAVPAGALAIGYWIAYIQLFIHEGAHYNLASDRRMNDLLCDYLVCWMVGTTIKDYRVTHFQHHRKLGLHDDTERSYFNRMSTAFILSMLTGVYAVRVFLSRKPQEKAEPARPNTGLLRGILMHLALLVGLVTCGAWPAALAWIGAMGVAFPFFGALRQILEHRSDAADPAANYQEIDHGATTRIFGDSFFSRTFGGAGFNRHLLHHWEPTISYTRLGDFEAYLMKTSAARIIASRKTSYMKALLDIYRNDNRA